MEGGGEWSPGAEGSHVSCHLEDYLQGAETEAHLYKVANNKRQRDEKP